MQVDFILS